ncbi:glutathione S-transferase C-terminal-like protein [Lentinus tigrinus ALCF2SS1-7]|uniref:glutathione transferase n=1 Tax=Lentinus tigrinus ALCF2SS1-6 TaxID=1328759 RepID=A0A5C2SEY3_9APHY|nr:glutathione S-transferase C-terminal-like protein [Lentinus tigrinus ALCF2SS1-6]RPD77851.1 glutathione S-transferase C-terminal-like protein [Lentinus tigrinus ALCF2SS1-7]
MSHGKHFTLYSNQGGPNGWKVVMVLEELGLSYETIYLDLYKEESKSPEFLKVNPNGRIPALIDHKNDDFVIWESDAIMLYLVDKYDTEHKISAAETNGKYHQLQWLFFQASGQGPYFGQAGWFKLFHPEKVPSAQQRYQKEILRVWGVLDSVLSKREWLVGDKCTIADLSFVPWDLTALKFLMTDYEGFSEETFQKDFPAVKRWHTAMMTREAVVKTWAVRNAANKA